VKGNEIFDRVDVEPSGNPFNSLVQLEYEQGIPRNPLINSGALVICDILLSEFRDPKNELLNFVRTLAVDENIHYNEKIAESEKKTGHRNSALINLLKSFGNIENPVEDVLDFYFESCAIEMTCEELARSFLIYANDGRLAHNNEQIISLSESKRINAIMQTCGFYDEAGEFSFRVGLPGKSGVGGGIAAVHPDHYSVAVWSPRLNEKGNSALGMKALEALTTLSGLSIF
jgi:glutaminase